MSQTLVTPLRVAFARPQVGMVPVALRLTAAPVTSVVTRRTSASRCPPYSARGGLANFGLERKVSSTKRLD